jgi:hypothetical protein
MTVHPLHIQLPEALYQRLQRAAEVTNQPLQTIVIQTIRGNLPPLLDDLRPEWREAVADLSALSDEALWAIARKPLPSRQWGRHQRLLRKMQESVLTEAEKTALAALRADADRSVTRRSYALALLKWRGHTLPSIDG